MIPEITKADIQWAAETLLGWEYSSSIKTYFKENEVLISASRFNPHKSRDDMALLYPVIGRLGHKLQDKFAFAVLDNWIDSNNLPLNWLPANQEFLILTASPEAQFSALLEIREQIIEALALLKLDQIMQEYGVDDY